VATNLADVVAESAAERPANVAVIDQERRITYAGLDDQITALAAGLRARGIESGDRVAIVLGNRLEFVVSLYAILRAGAVAVPLNTSSTPAELEHAIGTTGARAVLTDHECSEPLRQADIGSCALFTASGPPWEALMANADPALIPQQTDPDSLAILLFTAGSTGTPKAAMLTHSCLLANVSALMELRDPPAVAPGDVTLAVLPLFHVYSLNAVLSLTLAAGATVVLSRRFSARETLEQVSTCRVTVVAGAPPMYVAWSAEPGLRRALAGVRLLTSGAAPLPPELFDQFRTVTGLPIWEGYGLTECSPVVATSLVNGVPRSGSVGAPLPNVEVRVVPGSHPPLDGVADWDDDDDDTGQIWVRGPSVFAGYWPDGRGGPDEHGWFATGDIGYFDDHGCLRLVARRADLVLVSGFNVYPREVEQAIEEMDSVAECAVIGVDHPYTGQAVKAFVVARDGAAVTPEEVLTWCESRLARYKCPTIVEAVESLPRAPTGKLARGRLR
jgi:long-chain acyl-CoA synthetase